jgi:hypothetical protein
VTSNAGETNLCTKMRQVSIGGGRSPGGAAAAYAVGQVGTADVADVLAVGNGALALKARSTAANGGKKRSTEY